MTCDRISRIVKQVRHSTAPYVGRSLADVSLARLMKHLFVPQIMPVWVMIVSRGVSWGCG
jgi:hypothetical protein